MRILIVEPAGNLWGSERALLDLLVGAEGTEFAVCCPSGTPIISLLESRGAACLPFYIAGLDQKSRTDWLRASVGVLKACLAYKPDVIHINQAGAFRTCLPAARLLGLPLVCHVRIYEDVLYLARRVPRRHSGLGVVAVSESIGAELRAQPTLAGLPIRVLYDPFVLPPQPPDFYNNPVRFLCIGRISPSKGQHVLVEAVLDHRLDELAEVLIIGTGEVDYVRTLMDRAGDKVIWHGFDPEAALIPRPGDIMVVPSKKEPLGRVIFEAWAAGAFPVAFRDSGGAAEIIQMSEAGLLCKSFSSDALATGLRQAWELDSRRRIELAARGRRWVQQNCDPVGRAAALRSFTSEIVASQ